MSPPEPCGMPPRRAVPVRGVLLGLCAALLGLCAASSPAPASATTVSDNWAGYVALPASAGASSGFQSVSGSWTQPRVTCTRGHESFSAVWVGLGGFHESSRALEQIGSEADCSRAGRASYMTWSELIPAAPVILRMRTAPGNAMTASVTVRGHHVTMRLRNLTTGARYSITRKISAVDTSSADWIVEAPSTCFTERNCSALALSDFGSVAFSSATARMGSHTDQVAGPGWSVVQLELRQGAGTNGPASRRNARAQPGAAVVAATPSALSGPLGSFSVLFSEQQPQSEEPPEERPLPRYYAALGRS